jgi:hypothetical protein
MTIGMLSFPSGNVRGSTVSSQRLEAGLHMSVKDLERRLSRLTGTQTLPGVRELIVIGPVVGSLLAGE